MTVTPAPVAAVPTPVVPVPVVSPADLLGFETPNLRLRRHGGMKIWISGRQPFICAKRMRRQRRGLRSRAQRGGSGAKANGELQKVAAFHDISLFRSGE
jgi:hypothetical protein